MGDWIAFWDSEHSIYVNARHRDVHYRRIAQDIRAHLPAGAAVLDYGCGEALHADIVAETAGRLILCEAAPMVRAALGRRFGNNPKIEVRAPEEIAALPLRVDRRRGAALGRAIPQPEGARRVARPVPTASAAQTASSSWAISFRRMSRP